MMADGVRIRPEAAADIAEIRALNEAAFAASTEADLVEALRGHVPGILRGHAGVIRYDVAFANV